MIKIISPLYIYTSKNKKRIINLNNYRNWHYLTNSRIKNLYKIEMLDKLYGLKLTTPIDLHFILFKGTKRKSDRANVLSIQEKFFCDALTYYKCIPDDNDEYINSTHYSSGGIDRENPRVEIIINTFDKSR